MSSPAARTPSRLRSLYGRSLYGALLLVVFAGLLAPAVVGSYLLVGLQQRAGASPNDTLQGNYALVLALQLAVSLLLIALLLRRRLLSPLRKLMRFSDRLARGDFETPLALSAHDELGQLGEQMERMRLAIRDLFADVARREEQFRTIVTQVPGAVYRVRAGGAIEFVSDEIE